MNLEERLIAWLSFNQRPCEERDLLNDALEELEEKAARLAEAEAAMEERTLQHQTQLDNAVRLTTENESLAARLAEAKKASEWRDAILGLVATWPEYESLPWGGDKSGWGFVFEMLKLVHKRLAAAEEALQRQLEITYQYREQRDKAYGCVRNAIPGDYSTNSIDSDMGRMFQETIQKAVKRSEILEQRLAAAEALWGTAVQFEGSDWADHIAQSVEAERAGRL